MTGADKRKQVEVKNEDGKREKLFLYFDGETVSGKVHVVPKIPGKKLDHNGIKIEFLGQIGNLYLCCIKYSISYSYLLYTQGPCGFGEQAYSV